MVKGLQPRRLAAIDLDGTLVRGNTLHEYIRLGLGEELRAGRMANFLSIATLLGLRAVRLVSHRRMKFGSLRHIRPTERLRRRFAERISGMLNPEVTALIDELRAEGAEILLATAAPDIYIPWIWDGDFIATRTHANPTMEENRGEAKLRAVLDYARTRGLELYAVVTDHEDDRPLLSAGAPRTIVVKPDTK